MRYAARLVGVDVAAWELTVHELTDAGELTGRSVFSDLIGVPEGNPTVAADVRLAIAGSFRVGDWEPAGGDPDGPWWCEVASADRGARFDPGPGPRHDPPG